MKAIYFVLASLCLCFSVSAQLRPGDRVPEVVLSNMVNYGGYSSVHCEDRYDSFFIRNGPTNSISLLRNAERSCRTVASADRRKRKVKLAVFNPCP